MHTLKRLLIFMTIVLLPVTLTAQQITSYKFSFGPASEVPGYIKVNPSDRYSDETGYGFDFSTVPFTVDKDDDLWASWGQMFPKFPKQGTAVSNQAESGLSLGSFLSSNRLKKVLNLAALRSSAYP